MIALAFLNPHLLWAVPLAAVPIIIHLLNRRRYVKVPWAAMEYLLAAMKRNRKRLRMEQWLVLLLRTLAVLLLALLVARPQLDGGGLIGSVTHHVVLLDDSASMQQRVGSGTLFSRAQDQVKRLADRLGETRGGDLFSLVRASKRSQPDLWAQRVSPDLGSRVGTMLKEFSAQDGVADLGSFLDGCRERATAGEDAGVIEYYIVGDSRKVDWLTADGKAHPEVLEAFAAFDPLVEHASTMVVGNRDADNLAIVDVRRVDRFAVVGVPVELAVDVQNLGLDATPAAEVAVEVAGRSRVVRPVPSLAPGERVTVPVLHTFRDAGHHNVDTALQPADRYPIDNGRSLAIEVMQSSRVLLVDGDPDEVGSEGETVFLQVALDPGGDQPSGIETQVVTEAELGEVDLEPFDAVYLCNVPTPTEAAVERLEQFVAAGGGLVIFLGSQVDSEGYNERLFKAGKGLLPLSVSDIAGDPDRREHVALVDTDHPICGGMGELLQLLCNNAVLVKRYLVLEERPESGARILARITDADGPPWIVSRTFGSGGEVVLCSVSADKHWSNLPDTDANLILAHQMHRFVARSRGVAGNNLSTDGLFQLRVDTGLYKPDVTLRAVGGDGESATYTATPSADDSEGQQAIAVAMTDLHTLGAFEVEMQLHSGNVDRRMFARNVPSGEGRLARFDAADFDRAFPEELRDRLTFREESAGLGADSGEGELWRWLGLLMLCALMVETVLSWRFGRR